MELWRARGYGGVTPITRKLLQYRGDPTGADRVLYCQREAAETAIYLAEVAGRHGEPAPGWTPTTPCRTTASPRAGLKTATGTGKTVVMAMLIAWQVANKAFSPRDARFTNRFLVVTPGITIRDRLRVLLPSDDQNYYDLRGLAPPRGALHAGQRVDRDHELPLFRAPCGQGDSERRRHHPQMV